MKVKAFLLINKYSLNFLEGGTIFPSSIACVIPANSPQEIAEILGGRYLSVIDYRAQLREAIYFPKELFTRGTDDILEYRSGPIKLHMRDDEGCYDEEGRYLEGSYFYIFEVPFFQASKVKA